MKVQRAALRAPRGQMSTACPREPLVNKVRCASLGGGPQAMAVPRSRFRRNPKGAWVLLGSAIVRSPKVARPRMRASLPLLLLDDPHRDRLRRAGRLSGLSLPVARPRIRALRTTECQDNHSVGVRCASSPHFHSPISKFARSGTLSVNTHARDPLYFHHGLLA